MPSPSAAMRNAVQRAGPSAGNIFAPDPSESRYSQIARESNSAEPSSITRVGILPSALAAMIAGLGSTGLRVWVSASIRSAMPSSMAQTMTLRAKGEA